MSKTRCYVQFEDGTHKTYRSFKAYAKEASTKMTRIHLVSPVPGCSCLYVRNADRETYRREK